MLNKKQKLDIKELEETFEELGNEEEEICVAS